MLLLVFFVACAPVAGTAASLEGTRWALSTDAAVTLAFEEGQATGSGGCNQYRASYTASGASLTFGPALATKRACVDEARNARETAYFDALGKVASYGVSGDRLTLLDASGATLLELDRQR